MNPNNHERRSDEIHVGNGIVLFTTVPHREEGLMLGRQLVEEGLAACCTLLPGGTSIYIWEGTIEEGEEVILMIKSWNDRYQALHDKLQELHPYELPEIISYDITSGSREYLHWLYASTR